MRFLAIDHLAMCCHDVNKQVEWYCKIMGMKRVGDDGKWPASVVIGFEGNTNGGAMMELMPVRDPGASAETFARFQHGLRHFAFRVDDFDAAYKRLGEMGVKFLFEPVQAVGGGKIVSFRDPEGNEVQIVQRSGTDK
jgi:glyoxylase I family protein